MAGFIPGAAPIVAGVEGLLGGGNSSTAPILAGALNQDAAKNAAGQIQNYTNTASNNVNQNTSNYQNALLSLYGQLQNPATTGAYKPQMLSSTPQVSAARLAPGAGGGYTNANVQGGGSNPGAGFQFQAPNYAAILAAMQPQGLNAPVPGSPPATPAAPPAAPGAAPVLRAPQ